MRSLAPDLLEQARSLAAIDPKRPKVANLRRAISAAYYSLFHLLLDDFERQFVPALRRCVTHNDMTRASRMIEDLYKEQQQPTGPKTKASLILKDITISTDLLAVASSFIALQKARHEADYGVHTGHSRSDALANIMRCEKAHAAWGVCRPRLEARAYTSLFFIEPNDKKLVER